MVRSSGPEMAMEMKSNSSDGERTCSGRFLFITRVISELAFASVYRRVSADGRTKKEIFLL